MALVPAGIGGGGARGGSAGLDGTAFRFAARDELANGESVQSFFERRQAEPVRLLRHDRPHLWLERRISTPDCFRSSRRGMRLRLPLLPECRASSGQFPTERPAPEVRESGVYRDFGKESLAVGFILCEQAADIIQILHSPLWIVHLRHVRTLG